MHILLWITFDLLNLGLAYGDSDLSTTLLGNLVDVRIILLMFGIYLLKGIKREDPKPVRFGRRASVILSFGAITLLTVESLPVKLVVKFREFNRAYEGRFYENQFIEAMPNEDRHGIYNELDKAIK